MAPTIPHPLARLRRPRALFSASTIVAGAKSGYHLFKIKGYSVTKATVPNGKCVESCPFRVAGHTWPIKYYPNGDRLGTAEYVSLYLLLKDPVADGIVVQFVTSFNDQVEKQKPSYISNVMAHEFGTTNGEWGYKEFIKENLRKEGRLKDDCFTIRCDMIVAGEPHAENSAIPSPPSLVVPPSDWPQHFCTLLQNAQHADVRFLVGNKTFSAHRCVLAARSSIFNAQLFGAMKEGTTTEDCIQIDDMIPLVFKNLLHFIYTDSLLEMEVEEEASALMAQHLLEAADRYDMQRLKLIFEDRLCRHINVSTVVTTLVLAEQHNSKDLKGVCFEFLKSPKTLDVIMATDEFQELAKSCPSALFELMSKLAAR